MDIYDKLNYVLKTAAERKPDPKAKVRNRKGAIFQAGHANVKDNKDHFPIDTIGRARNALARAGQFSSAPSWYNGSLESFKSTVSSAVHRKYPSIKSPKKKKKADAELLYLVKLALKDCNDARYNPNIVDADELDEYSDPEINEIFNRSISEEEGPLGTGDGTGEDMEITDDEIEYLASKASGLHLVRKALNNY